MSPRGFARDGRAVIRGESWRRIVGDSGPAAVYGPRMPTASLDPPRKCRLARPAFHRATFGLAFGLLAGAAAGPALATSCDTHAIEARSVEETARAIWETSDLIGFGFVRQLPGAPALQQQEVEIFAPLKGEASVVRLAPERVNRVGRVDGMVRWFHAKPEEVRLFALVHTPEGAATHICQIANIVSKPAAELYPALVRLARARGSIPR